LKIKLFPWLAAANKILTWDNLIHRGWEGPNICLLCRLNSESVTHLFIDCTFTQQVWRRLSFALKLRSTWSGSSLKNCLEDWAKEESLYPHLPALVSWHIWLVRNRTIFDQLLPFIDVICYKTLGGLEGLKTLNDPSSCFLQPTYQQGRTTAWFDGASQKYGLQCGAGSMIKLTDHTKITWTYNYGEGTKTKVELLCAWATLTLATKLNILELQVLGDSRIIIDWLNNKGKLQAIALECWKDRIFELIKGFTRNNFTHIFRELNEEVDHLSKSDLQEQAGNLTFYEWIDGHVRPTQHIYLY
jgi:ribonuclease HI